MILKITNLVILAFVITNAFWLINKRFQTRTDYTYLALLNNKALEMNKEYTRLQIEEGTFSSNLILQDFAKNKLNLVDADKKQIVKVE
jgi:cell division protein FtsL